MHGTDPGRQGDSSCACLQTNALFTISSLFSPYKQLSETSEERLPSPGLLFAEALTKMPEYFLFLSIFCDEFLRNAMPYTFRGLSSAAFSVLHLKKRHIMKKPRQTNRFLNLLRKGWGHAASITIENTFYA